jgi:hypothetical protein
VRFVICKQIDTAVGLPKHSVAKPKKKLYSDAQKANAEKELLGITLNAGKTPVIKKTFFKDRIINVKSSCL